MTSSAWARLGTVTIGRCSVAPADAFTAAAVSGAAWWRGTHDAVRATRFRAARDRADVLRILDAVEHHEQRGRAHLVEQVVDRERCACVEVPCHALVMLGVGDVIEPLSRHLLHEDVARLGMLEDLGQARLGTDRRLRSTILRAGRPARRASSTGLRP